MAFLTQDSLEDAEDCPFSLLLWMGRELGLPRRLLETVGEILLAMLGAPASGSIESGELVASAVLVALADGAIPAPEVDWWRVFGLSLGQVSVIALMLNENMRPLPLQQLLDDLPSSHEFSPDFDEIFSEDELSSLTSSRTEKTQSRR